MASATISALLQALLRRAQKSQELLRGGGGAPARLHGPNPGQQSGDPAFMKQLEQLSDPEKSLGVATTPAPVHRDIQTGEIVEGRIGPGPDTLQRNTGIVSDPLEESVRDKRTLELIQDEMDKLSTEGVEVSGKQVDGKNLTQQELEEFATQNVEASFRTGRKSYKGKTVTQRDAALARRAQILRDDPTSRYAPRGSRVNLEQSPTVFGEEGAPITRRTEGITDALDDAIQAEEAGQALTRGIIDEATGPKELVRRPTLQGKSFKESSEQLDDLFGGEEAKDIAEIKEILRKQGRTGDRDAAEVVAADVVLARRINETRKIAFERYAKIAERLKFTEKELKNSSPEVLAQLRASSKRLMNFKREMTRGLNKARDENDLELAESFLDRLEDVQSGVVKRQKSMDELSSLLKTLRLREEANVVQGLGPEERKLFFALPRSERRVFIRAKLRGEDVSLGGEKNRATNNPRSTTGIKRRIDELKDLRDDQLRRHRSLAGQNFWR